MLFRSDQETRGRVKIRPKKARPGLFLGTLASSGQTLAVEGGVFAGSFQPLGGKFQNLPNLPNVENWDIGQLLYYVLAVK